MNRVKELIAAGLPLSEAIKQALKEQGLSQTSLASKHKLSTTMTNEVINLDRTPRSEVVRALAAELGGRPYDWARVFWENSEPKPASFAAAS